MWLQVFLFVKGNTKKKTLEIKRSVQLAAIFRISEYNFGVFFRCDAQTHLSSCPCSAGLSIPMSDGAARTYKGEM